ncbi:MAG TPA: Rid family hydrolase, partial [Bacteroidales bacterium]|nr:Rid family hydrolase [Bacteroidales bacterium]
DRITYLRGLTHLSPTNIYGVTFERGVALRFDDRTQVLISGTASIDQWGNVMHLDDITSQTLRMWENVEVLLHEAGSNFEDVAQIIVYLRRQEDNELVHDLFRSRFPSIPTIIVMGRVCRPAWLIEMECIATTQP